MARPNKNGLEYFPLDVNCDDKIKLIDAKFGVEGFGIVIKLWQIIYDNGYFIEWTERELLLYRNRINADINLINAVINECVKWDLFDSNMFDLNILTSKGIQKRYFEAIKRRTEITIDEAYWLLPLPESTTKINVHINRVNVDINSKNVDINSHSKVNRKESKVKKTESIDILTFGSQKNIRLSQNDLDSLRSDYPDDYLDAVEYLSLYIAEKGDKSKSKNHSLTIRRWVIDAVREKRERKNSKQPQQGMNSNGQKKTAAEGFFEVANGHK